VNTESNRTDCINLSSVRQRSVANHAREAPAADSQHTIRLLQLDAGLMRAGRQSSLLVWAYGLDLPRLRCLEHQGEKIIHIIKSNHLVWLEHDPVNQILVLAQFLARRDKASSCKRLAFYPLTCHSRRYQLT